MIKSQHVTEMLKKKNKGCVCKADLCINCFVKVKSLFSVGIQGCAGLMGRFLMGPIFYKNFRKYESVFVTLSQKFQVFTCKLYKMDLCFKKNP